MERVPELEQEREREGGRKKETVGNDKRTWRREEGVGEGEVKCMSERERELK